MSTAETLLAMRKYRRTLIEIVTLIGNVDHTQGNGPNSAKQQGILLNRVRQIAQDALNEKDAT